jgi:sugar phosphate isomerase/epimerase
MHLNRLGLDSQTVFGMPPTDHIKLAAELGCGHVTLAPMPVPWKLKRFPLWSLRDDVALQGETRAILRDTGVRLAVAEGFTIRPGTEAGDRVSDFDLMAKLGAEAAASVSMETDASRALDQMAVLADFAAERGMTFLFEFAPPHTFNTLESAFTAVQQLQRNNVRLLIDSMHLFRTGGSVAGIRALPDGAIGYTQLSDAPTEGDGGDYYLEASFERKVPGEGDLPLFELLQALPSDVRIGLEVPMCKAMNASHHSNEPIARIVEAARAMLDQAA